MCVLLVITSSPGFVAYKVDGDGDGDSELPNTVMVMVIELVACSIQITGKLG